jgi:matrixin
VLLLTLAPSAGAWRTTGRQWRTGTIRYASIAPDYEWSLQQAVRAWNASGARVRFVRVPRGKAQVIVGARLDAGDEREAGLAETYAVYRWINSATVYIRSGTTSYAAAQILAHELGHVLGLGHEDRACATMNSVLRVDHPFRCAPPPRGMWRCGLVTADDAAAAVHLYGGKARPPARELCSVRE